MSLYEADMESCTFLDQTTVYDDIGGYVTRYVPGAEFSAAIVLEDSINANIARKQGVKDLYWVSVKKIVPLRVDQVFRRNSDGRTFRVTRNGDENTTPFSAGIDMRRVRAEEFILPND